MRKNIFISELAEPEVLKRVIRDTGVGLESIRFSIGDNLDALDAEIRKARLFLQELGNPPLSLHGPFLDLNPMSYDSCIQRVCRKRYEECYTAAQALEASRIVFHSGMIPATCMTHGWAERMADFWMDFLQDKRGIVCLMENVFDREPAPLLEAASRIHHPDFGLCLDVGHAHCFSEYAPAVWFRELQPYIRHLHLHDNDGTRDRHLAMGDGSISFAFLRTVRTEVGCTVECCAEEDIRRSLLFLEEQLPDAY